MADTDLTVTGKDVQVALSINGVPIRIVDAVVMTSAEPVLSEITQRHLGTSDVDVDVEHEGWKGELEISNKTADVDTLLDAAIASSRNRVPYVINIRETTRYRDGTSRSYTYPDCKLTAASRSAKRAEASTHRLSWRTGKNRIAG